MTALKKESSPSRWSSQLSFILAATGAAVGLGNIWKFPYEVGSNGGSAFVITYILLLCLVGIPLLMTEMLLGKIGRANPIASIKKLALQSKASPFWSLLGWMNIITLVLVLSFYSVVAGWSIKYILISVFGFLQHANGTDSHQIWQQTISNPTEIILYHAVFMSLTIAVVMRGVKDGIERANNILMPMLFAMLVMLVIYCMYLPGFSQAWQFLFTLDLSTINAQTIVHAMGQTCFTLAIGAGCMLVYGAYVDENTNLGSTSIIIACTNLLVALLVGLVIFPLVFSYHLPPSAGPGLLFETLPIAFANLPFGSMLSAIFFTLILFAAWTSSISIAEPTVLMLIEERQYSRIKAALITGLSTWVLGLLSALSFNVLSDYSILGFSDFFTAISTIATDILLPCGILGVTIFCGWIVPKKVLTNQVGLSNQRLLNSWYNLVRYLAPIVVFTIVISPWVQ